MCEGCHGGWGFIDGLFLKHYYAVDESCAPYLGTKHIQGCSAYAHCEPSAKIDDIFYIGGHYGNANEEIIMKEIRQKGPVLLDFNADQRFQTYKSGVLVDDEINLNQ